MLISFKISIGNYVEIISYFANFTEGRASIKTLTLNGLAGLIKSVKRFFTLLILVKKKILREQGVAPSPLLEDLSIFFNPPLGNTRRNTQTI